jgi:hypothetical protein
MSYVDSPIRTFKCETCGRVEKIDVRTDDRGLFEAVQCTCDSLMKPYSDPNQAPINMEDIDAGRGLPTILG